MNHTMTTIWLTAVCGSICLGLPGCQDNIDRGDDESTFGVPSTGDTGGPAEGQTTGGSDPWDDDSDGGSSGGDGSNDGEAPSHRCDAIDILFVIDAPAIPAMDPTLEGDCNTWPSDPDWDAWWDQVQDYRSHYGKLEQGFATLVSELYVTLQVPDFHILVTGDRIPTPRVWSTAQEYEDYCVSVEPEVDGCDEVLGAGRNGFSSSPGDDLYDYAIEECMAGRFVPSGAEDLSDSFSCLIDQDRYWDYYVEWGLGAWAYGGEGPGSLMSSMTAAVTPTGETAECNAGFLRDDALLVVIVLEVGVDSDSDTSTGTLEAWKDALVATKGGDEDRVVMLALVPDGDQPHPLCPGEHSTALSPQLRDLVDAFPHGMWGSSCLLDYPTFFRAGAQEIDAACSAGVQTGQGAG